MKSLLIIANLCHASPRIPGLARYLPEMGWSPTIVAPGMTEQQKEFMLFDRGKDLFIVETEGYMTPYDLGGGGVPKVVSFPVRVIKGVGRRIYRRTLYPIVTYPDEERKWTPYCLKTVFNLITSRRFDAVLSSSSPVTCHVITKKISSVLRIPWVADLRDPWTQNMAYPYGPLRKVVERGLEKRTLRPAAHLITVTPQCAAKLQELHRNPISCVTNGYDDLYDHDGMALTGQFTITYTGNIYPQRRDPKKIVRALAELITEGKIAREDVELRFFGTPKAFLQRELGQESVGIEDRIKVYERVSRAESYRRQLESQILVDFNWEDPEVKGVAPSKFYEYLRARRPIIATGGYGGDFIESVLTSTRAGRYCQTHRQLRDALLDYYREFKEQGAVGYAGVESEIQRYSYRSIARQLSSILDATVGSAQT